MVSGELVGRLVRGKTNTIAEADKEKKQSSILDFLQDV
jgi:hypothetical protein